MSDNKELYSVYVDPGDYCETEAVFPKDQATEILKLFLCVFANAGTTLYSSGIKNSKGEHC